MGADGAHDLEAVHLGHLNVQQHQIRAHGLDDVHGLLAAVAEGDDFHVRFAREEAAQACEGQRLIVHGDDSDG